MVLRSDKEKVKTLLSETIRLLCKNGLHFKSEFCVEALVGITLDKNEEFFLSIKETVKTDLVPSTREGISIQRKLKSEKKNRDVVVKGELGSSPVAKKRPAETVTSEGETRSDSGELGNLSLGEEGDQQFWSSVTEGGGGDNEGGGTPFKKRHIQHPDESSNSEPQIVIKGEPESDSDIEEIASTSQESHQQPSNMSNMPASFTSFGSPSTSSQSFSGSVSHTAIAQQVWDQLPPFSTLPGTSGIPSTPNTVTTPDGQQQSSIQPLQEITKSDTSVQTETTEPSPTTTVTTSSSVAPIPMGVWIPSVGTTALTTLPTTQNPILYTPTKSGTRGQKMKHRCPTCDTPCVNKGSLLRHMKIHLESPEFKCNVCGQSYYEKWRLMRHMKSKNHGNPLPYGGAIEVRSPPEPMDRGTAPSTGTIDRGTTHNLTPLDRSSAHDLTTLERGSAHDLTTLDRGSAHNLSPLDRGGPNMSPMDRGVVNNISMFPTFQRIHQT